MPRANHQIRDAVAPISTLIRGVSALQSACEAVSALPDDIDNPAAAQAWTQVANSLCAMTKFVSNPKSRRELETICTTACLQAQVYANPSA